jgi:hypothetical protein
MVSSVLRFDVEVRNVEQYNVKKTKNVEFTWHPAPQGLFTRPGIKWDISIIKFG